ncbi:MAG: hypothetical protein JWO46_1621 [Nocardioidaceae bacterium]|nr:hypothetical protein [Nocardioidaceae bacterium]
MKFTKIIGGTAAAVVVAAVLAGPAEAAPSAQAGVTTVAHKAAVSAGAADRKKKKAKVAISVAPNPTRCYNISVQVTKRHVPQPGAVLRIQSLSHGKWRNTVDAPVTTDANGAASFVAAGLHKNNGAASNDKLRFKLNKKVHSRGVRVPCAFVG